MRSLNLLLNVLILSILLFTAGITEATMSLTNRFCVLGLVVMQEELDSDVDSPLESPPSGIQEYVSEEIVIYPGSREELVISSRDIDREQPELLSDILVREPDVHAIGVGGALTTISIGGLGRQRIQTLINGFRVSAARRAGTDLGTLIPGLIDSIRVYRGGTSLAFGSEAMGGVIDFSLLSPDLKSNHSDLTFRYRGNDSHVMGGFRSTWRTGTVAGAYDAAGKYRTPDGTLHDGSFSRYNGLASFLVPGTTWTSRIDLLFTRGEDIGKPSTSSSVTVYPEDEVHMLGFSVSNHYLSAKLGTIYQNLKTESDDERSSIESYNYHGKLLTDLKPFMVGLEVYTRQNVRATNQTPDADSKPLWDASSLEVAPFASSDVSFTDDLSVEAGARYEFSQASNGSTTKDGSFFSGMLALTRQIPGGEFDVSFFNNYRFPSLEEYFYTGITARGYIEGNPDLDPESGIGARIAAKRDFRLVSLGLSYQIQECRNFISRVKTGDDHYTIVNLDKARIQDLTLQILTQSLTIGYSWTEGVNSDTGDPVDDIPPMKVLIAWQQTFGMWTPSCSLRHMFRQNRIGPSEQAVDSYSLFDMGVSVVLTDYVKLGLLGSNLLDEEYFPSADEKAAIAPGRSINVSLAITF